MQVKQIGIVLQSFYYNRGREGFVQGEGEGGIVNCRGVNNKNKANELTTLLQRLKILAGAVILKNEVSMIQDG